MSREIQSILKFWMKLLYVFNLPPICDTEVHSCYLYTMTTVKLKVWMIFKDLTTEIGDILLICYRNALGIFKVISLMKPVL